MRFKIILLLMLFVVWIIVGLSTVAQAGTLPATITMTADDEFQIWLNGDYISGNYGVPLRDPTRSAPPNYFWEPLSFQVTLYDDSPNVIAVWAWDFYGIEDMLSGEVRFPTGLLVTSTAWKATGTPGTGNWWETGYDDSSWGQAIKLGVNDGWGYPWRTGGIPIPGIDPSAEYIWADGVPKGQGLDSTAYFRMTFNAAPIPEPSTLLFLGSGLAGLVVFGRKKLFKKA